MILSTTCFVCLITCVLACRILTSTYLLFLLSVGTCQYALTSTPALTHTRAHLRILIRVATHPNLHRHANSAAHAQRGNAIALIAIA